MIEFFSSSPEAISTLLVFAIGGLVTIILFIFSLFANYPVIVRLLTNTSLISVDSALQEKVKVTFEQLGQIREIHELRQMELEIFNSHPRQQVNDKTITIHLESDKVTILGVTAANIDNQTPELGGRRIIARIEQVPTTPPDPFFRTSAPLFYPAVVVSIPYLEKVTQDDRILLRVTYNGPLLLPKVQGAELKSSKKYYSRQNIVLFIAALAGSSIGYYFWNMAAHSAGLVVPNFNLFTYWGSPYFLVGTIFIIVSTFVTALFLVKERWFRKRMRTLPNPLIPPPYETEDLVKLYYHDTMKQP